MPGDYDGDGKTDIAVFRPVDRAVVHRQLEHGEQGSCRRGAAARTSRCPATTTATARPTSRSSGPSTGHGSSSTRARTSSVYSGAAGDIPVAGDYDGDGRTDIGVFRPRPAWFIVVLGARPAIEQWGAPGDHEIPADYDGDGRTDIAVFRTATGVWYIARLPHVGQQRSSTGAAQGTAGAGDYDGDGNTDMAVFRPSTAPG